MFRRPLGQSEPPFPSSRFERGLSTYAANNSTAMAAPLELSPEDIARLDNDITTHGFREDVLLRPPSPYETGPKYSYTNQEYMDKENNADHYQGRNNLNTNRPAEKENYYQRPMNDFRRAEEVGRLVTDIAMPPSSDPYFDNSPLQLRRSTSDAARNRVITPPTSSSPNVDKHQEQVRRPLAPLKPRQLDNYNYQEPRYDENYLGKPANNGNNGALIEMQNMYEDRIDQIKRAEAEKIAALEAEYKQRISKLQQDMNMIVEKQEHVMKLKGQVEGEVVQDLERAKADLKLESNHRRSEREKFEGRIKELQGRVDELQKKLKKYSAGFGPATDKLSTSSSMSSTIKSYEARIAQMQQEHDQKISSLIKQFEREKQSAMDILKTRIKSEINLLVPRIRQQCQSAFNQALIRCQEETSKKYRDKYGTIIRRLKEEHQAEKRFIQKQAKEAADLEKADWQKRVKAKYEMRALEVKNDCERRLLERMRKPVTNNNVSFMVSDDGTQSTDISSFYNADGISFL